MTEENGKAHAHEQSGCLFCQATEAMGRMFSAFGPSEQAQEHFRQSRVEFLKGIRRVVDDRIEKASRDPHHRGARIVVE